MAARLPPDFQTDSKTVYRAMHGAADRHMCGPQTAQKHRADQQLRPLVLVLAPRLPPTHFQTDSKSVYRAARGGADRHMCGPQTAQRHRANQQLWPQTDPTERTDRLQMNRRPATRRPEELRAASAARTMSDLNGLTRTDLWYRCLGLID